MVPNLYPALTPADVGRCDGGPGKESKGPGLGHGRPRPGPAQSETAARDRRGASPELFSALPATGAHEVIVNGPQSVLSLAELPVEQVMRRGGGVARADARARARAPTCS